MGGGGWRGVVLRRHALLSLLLLSLSSFFGFWFVVCVFWGVGVGGGGRLGGGGGRFLCVWAVVFVFVCFSFSPPLGFVCFCLF